MSSNSRPETIPVRLEWGSRSPSKLMEVEYGNAIGAAGLILGSAE